MDEVILVNDKDEAIGRMEKLAAHEQAVLHRAFSIFIFNSRNEMLLQRRALSKYHSGGLWTNACCSHPRPGEDTPDAATRRLNEELGFQTGIKKIFDFIYKAEFENGLTEYEFDHVFVGYYEGALQPDPAEVMETSFASMDQVLRSLREEPGKYTAWFGLAFPKLYSWWIDNKQHSPK